MTMANNPKISFDSLFLQSDQDINYLLKNIQTVVCDDQANKVNKVCDFTVKAKQPDV